MKLLKSCFYLAASLFMMTACGNDDVVNPNEEPKDNGDGVYMRVNISPYDKNGASRSYTDGDNSSSHGVEIGTDYENQVNGVLIVLATRVTNNEANNNLYIASSYVDNNQLNADNTKTIYQATAKFSKTTISGLYSHLSTIGALPANGNPSVNVYVYCNPSEALRNYFRPLESLSTNTWVNEAYKLASATDNALWQITGSVVGENPSARGNFMMTNVSMARRYFPPSIDAWAYYTTEANPFDLSGMNNEGTDNEVDNISGNGGSIDVHRMAARFDFRDGSQMGPEDGITNGNGVLGTPNTYNVMVTTTGETTIPLVQATIVNMSLVNLLNKQYYLGRVSPTGMETNVSLLGAEKPWFSNEYGTPLANSGNYVVSSYAAEKMAGITDYSQYYYYTCFDENGNVDYRNNVWYTEYLSDVLNPEKHPEDGTMQYRIWRYVTENTIPGETANQVNGVSTGVVFKAKLKGAEGLENSTDTWDKALYAALNNTSTTGRSPEKDPILYLFSGKLYCGWTHVQAAALAAAGFDATKGQDQELDRSSTLFKAVYGKGGVGEIKDAEGKVIYTDDSEAYPVDQQSANYLWTVWQAAGRPGATDPVTLAFKKAVTGATFTIYQTSQDNREGWGYYCYYFYWNRHNDNGNNGIMAPMEFATVRNNVYKLAVTRLNVLGHPRIPENDPDDPSPDTPDEKSDVYLTVSVKVLPWVVRFNNIEF